jgi:hypothetical protein
MQGHALALDRLAREKRKLTSRPTRRGRFAPSATYNRSVWTSR